MGEVSLRITDSQLRGLAYKLVPAEMIVDDSKSGFVAIVDVKSTGVDLSDIGSSRFIL